MTFVTTVAAVLTASCGTSVADADSAGDAVPRLNPKELGWVDWSRDYAHASQVAARTGKPMFLLFQEIPGCSTCVGFGEMVLSHPLLIEAIETEFVAIAIHNNKGGADAEVLAKFSEPSWNNPVVRFVDARGRDLVPRADGVWTTAGIAQRMVIALEAAERPVPDYLRWVVEETTAATRKATFAMGCYWSGEACLGDIDGVVATHAGWLDGREVVEVEYDRDRITESGLRRVASERSCGAFVAKAARAKTAKKSDRKYYLQRSAWDHVPLTPRQAARVNSALQSGEDPRRWVSPRQQALHAEIVRARSTRGAALAGLERPDDVRELARYHAKLRARLSRALGDRR